MAVLHEKSHFLYKCISIELLFSMYLIFLHSFDSDVHNRILIKK